MSNKLFQNLLYQIREIVDGEFGLIDEDRHIVISTKDPSMEEMTDIVSKFMYSRETQFENDSYIFQKVFIRNKMEYIAYIRNEGEQSARMLALICMNVANFKLYHDEKFDKANFLKNIIMDSILPGEIAIKAKELHLTYDACRVVFLIKTQRMRDIHSHEIIQGLFPNKAKDFIIVLDDENTVLIKELKSNNEFKEIDRTAKSIVDTLSAELMAKTYVGIGTIVDNIPDIARSFKEAQMSLHVGGIFESERFIVNYNNLGIGRLIYQLPTTLCRLFLKEVFKEDSFDSLDKETLFTIQKFFENSLIVSETARELYVHRNTLVYRLDKIQKITGLDLRKFDDAIIFKVAMLVKKYLDNEGHSV